MSEPLISEEEAAELLGKSESWLRQQRYAGTGPPHYKVGRTPVYDPDEILEWVRQSTSNTNETKEGERQG